MNASENKGCIGVAMTQQLLLRCSTSCIYAADRDAKQ
jgi:hypothetical protein